MTDPDRKPQTSMSLSSRNVVKACFSYLRRDNVWRDDIFVAPENIFRYFGNVLKWSKSLKTKRTIGNVIITFVWFVFCLKVPITSFKFFDLLYINTSFKTDRINFDNFCGCFSQFPSLESIAIIDIFLFIAFLHKVSSSEYFFFIIFRTEKSINSDFGDWNVSESHFVDVAAAAVVVVVVVPRKQSVVLMI